MTSRGLPSTPVTPTTAARAPSTPPTGSWRHPAMDEISRRQAAKSFTDSSFRRLTRNSLALVTSFAVVSALRRNDIVTSTMSIFPSFASTYLNYALWILRLLFCFNILSCLTCFLSPPDDFSDIALTPEQRKFLGLKPDTPLSVSAAKPGNFVTPPRYTKSTPTSRSSSPLPQNSSPTMQRKAALNGSGIGDVTGTPPRSPLRVAGPQWSPLGTSPKTIGLNSVVPSNRWAYEKNILQRKSDGLYTSPNKGIFNSPVKN